MTTIDTTSAQESAAVAAAIARTTLFTCGTTIRLQQCDEDDNQTIGKILGRLMKIQEEIERFIAANNVNRVALLEAELVEICEQGRIAEQELSLASAGVMLARQNDAALESALNRAARDLKNAKDSPLPRFYGDSDVAAKEANIATAQAAYDATLAEMQSVPLAIPTALRQKQDAERKVSALTARESECRKELATLTGNAAQPVGKLPSATGLAS